MRSNRGLLALRTKWWYKPNLAGGWSLETSRRLGNHPLELLSGPLSGGLHEAFGPQVRTEDGSE